MEWEDERIIYLRNEERKKSYSNLCTGMYVKEQDVAFALSKLIDHIPDDELRKNTIRVLKTLVSSSNPSIVLLNEGTFENECMSCNWFDFKSYTITGSIYNLSGIISFGKRTILAMFSCPYELNPWWIPIFLKILETFEEQAGKGGENEGHSYHQ